ncbi:glutathione S-transferase family protein [Seongchinamella sediminis]|uniref:Glutathione S-transferase family protein n=1 Tax=Seongchinamella sediminis TaxID=2283635 RepID=A0A3L7DWR5_9GAMM|nr:glutathione S-transferase family protein [Seongchinamella sediminis]RLQ21009.1 glutathione S-transferase family protein [Seongchinamella sediminis]
MKLYTYDPAPSPQRLALYMRCKGIEIDTEQVDMAAGEHLGEAYRAMVPDQTVPALILDDGTVLTEVIGIVHYLEALYPDRPLLGSSPLEKGLVTSWDSKIYSMIFMSIAEALRNSSPGFKGRALPGPLDLEQIPALAERGKKRLAWAWEQLDQRLADSPWIAGDSFSFADIDLVVSAGFSGWVKCTPPENLANLHAYLARARGEIG